MCSTTGRRSCSIPISSMWVASFRVSFYLFSFFWSEGPVFFACELIGFLCFRWYYDWTLIWDVWCLFVLAANYGSSWFCFRYCRHTIMVCFNLWSRTHFLVLFIFWSLCCLELLFLWFGLVYPNRIGSMQYTDVTFFVCFRALARAQGFHIRLTVTRSLRFFTVVKKRSFIIIAIFYRRL